MLNTAVKETVVFVHFVCQLSKNQVKNNYWKKTFKNKLSQNLRLRKAQQPNYASNKLFYVQNRTDNVLKLSINVLIL